MNLTIEEIRELHDKAFSRGQSVRERAADDLVFFHVTQWDDQTLGDSQLAYRGEFNMLKKAGNKILAEMNANPAHPNFEPIDETSDDAAELIDGMWRKDATSNKSKEAFHNAAQEAVVCGAGAWKLVNEYRNKRDGSREQVINRYPIYEANNNLFWSPDAKSVDKSDARYCSHLIPHTEDSYLEIFEEMTGRKSDYKKGKSGKYKNGSSFAYPEQSYTFPWFSETGLIYLCEFYYREKIKKKVYEVQTIFGDVITVSQETMDSVGDEMDSSGDEIISEKEVECWQVTRYLVSGEDILEKSIVPGEHIPIVPEYGYRAFVEGEEYYEGITRTAKDPQRLRNFQLSYLADIVSRSPRPKPIFAPEQIQGFESMYEDNGADNNYPYLLQHIKTPQGVDLPLGPVGMMPESQMPTALAASIAETKQAMEDVAGSGVPQSVTDPDISGKAVIAIQNQIDMVNYEYQEKRKFSIRRDAEIYASMASQIYDTPRKVVVENPDGSRKEIEIMQAMIDFETGKTVVLNNLSNAMFEVYADIGPAYSTQKQQTRDELITLAGTLDPNDPLRQILILKYINLSGGDDMKDVRDYARKQLVLMGIKEPETKEEIAMLQAASEPKEDPNMVLAQAEALKGQADMMNAQNKMAETQIKAYEAQTKRAKVEIDAQETGVNINKKIAETQGVRIDNVSKLRGSAIQSMR